MTKILLVWTTDLNSTRRMAEAVERGVRSVDGAECRNVALETGHELTRDDVRGVDGLILGTPVRHRNMHHRMKLFVEDVLEAAWLDDRMVGMVGATFSVGGGHGDMGAGAEMAQLGMLAAMAANGMILVTFPKCTPGGDHACLHWGAAGRSGGPKMEPYWPSQAMHEAGFHHGANVARVAGALAPHRDGLHARGNVSPTPELQEAFSQPPPEGLPDPSDNPAHRTEPPAGFVSGRPDPENADDD